VTLTVGADDIDFAKWVKDATIRRWGMQHNRQYNRPQLQAE